METCVLIPEALSLILKPRASHRERLDRRGLSLPEMGATLWANRTLQPGTSFRAEEGQIRLEKLEIYSKLCDSDVSKGFFN